MMRGLLPDDAEVPLLLAARDATFRAMERIMDAERRPGLTKPEAWLLDLARMSTIGRAAMLDSWRTHLLGTAFVPRPYGEKTSYGRAMRMAPCWPASLPWWAAGSRAGRSGAHRGRCSARL